jgi:uncharacterized DUF497 family protein
MVKKQYRWNLDKDVELRLERGISFQDVVDTLAQSGELDVVVHPNQERYPGQRIYVIRVNDYIYLVPFVEDEDHIFLKTIIPSRKATRNYLRRRQ